MLLDSLDNHGRSLGVDPGLDAALAWLAHMGPERLAALPEGRNDIDGDALYAMVAKGPGRRREEAHLETHDRHIDVQLVLSGVDEMGWKPRADLRSPLPDKPDARADVAFWTDEPDVWFTVRPGQFAVFFPEDAHLPMTGGAVMHKVIVKVRV